MGGSADGGRNAAHDITANLSVAPPARPYFNGMSAVATKIIAVSCYAGSYARLRMCRNAGTLRRQKRMKRDAHKLHKVACRFARRLPEGHCRMAVTPYPAYKTTNQTGRYSSLIIVKNRFTVRERQSAASTARYRYKAPVSSARGR